MNKCKDLQGDCLGESLLALLIGLSLSMSLCSMGVRIPPNLILGMAAGICLLIGVLNGWPCDEDELPTWMRILGILRTLVLIGAAIDVLSYLAGELLIKVGFLAADVNLTAPVLSIFIVGYYAGRWEAKEEDCR